MSTERFPVGLEMDVSYPDFQVSLTLLSTSQLKFEIKEGPFARIETVEPGLIIADGDLVAIHGRIRGWADEPQVVVDIFRVQNGKLVEHWDVLQNEVPATAGVAGLPMFDTKVLS